MIDLGENWKEIQSLEDGEFGQLPADGYVCVVTDAQAKQSQFTQKPMLVLTLDIAEGKYARFFQNGKYPPKLFKVVFDNNGHVSPYFKRLLEQFEQSNVQFKIERHFNEKELLNLKIGVIFRAEEFLNADNKVKIAVNPFRTTTTEKIRNKEFEVPPLKKIESVNEATKKKDGNDSTDGFEDGFQEVDIDDKQLPF